MNEFEVFQKLDKECRPDSMPLPHKLFDNCKNVIAFSLMSYLISEAFDEMRKTEGNTNWVTEASKINDKSMGKMYMTKNKLRKELIYCLGKKFICDINEIDDKIFVKVNACYLFE